MRHAVHDGLEWMRAAVGVKHRLVHHLRQRRVREDRAPSARPRCVSSVLAMRVALDQLGDLGADHVRAQQLAGLGVEHRLDHALGLAQRDRLAVADEREVADLDLVARLPWPPPRSGRRWRPAAGNRCSPGCCSASSGCTPFTPAIFSTQMHALVHRLVREPGRAGDVADRIDAGLAGAAPFVDHDVGASRPSPWCLRGRYSRHCRRCRRPRSRDRR